MENEKLINELINKGYHKAALAVIEKKWNKGYLITGSTVENNFRLTKNEVNSLIPELNYTVYKPTNGENVQLYLEAEVKKKAHSMRIKRMKLSNK